MKVSKDKIQGFMLGVMTVLLVSSSVSVASPAPTWISSKIGQDVEVIEFAVGEHIIPQEAFRNERVPFMIDGTAYLPIRDAMQWLGGDVAWDKDTRTVRARMANNILAFQEDEFIESIESGTNRVDFLVDCSTEVFGENAVYEYYWVIEHNHKVVEKTEKETVNTLNVGFNAWYYCDYEFKDLGTYGVSFMVRKVNSKEPWMAVAKRVLRVY